MKKSVLLLLSFVLSVTLVTACAPGFLPLIPTPTPEPAFIPVTGKTPIPILVPRFYDSEGLQIYVGKHSQQLDTGDVRELNLLEEEMARQRATLTPEQMFVLAIRLYDLGEKDTSVYWFYEAQFRAKLFQQALDASHATQVNAPSAALLASYDAFTKLAGEYINGYAGCDVDNWVKIAKSVQDDNPTAPELDKIFPEAVFVERDQWQRINDEVAAGLGVLIDRLSQMKEAIREQRAGTDQDARYCG